MGATSIDASPEEKNEEAIAPSSQLIEIGWIIAGRLSSVDRDAVETAHQQVLDLLNEMVPSFHWRMPMVHHPESVSGPQVEPVVLLNHALAERNINRWDFALVITEADLNAYRRSFAMAVISRALDAAVISTKRIDPRAAEPAAEDEYRAKMMARRVTALVMHALGHLNGLAHVDNPDNYMFHPEQLDDLDQLARLTDEQVSWLAASLAELADLRLEERSTGHRGAPITFYVRSAWINRREIATALWQAKPWEFPIRFSRLTVASISTMLVMLLTAEAWDLGASQPLLVTLTLPILAVAVTTAYVVFRQRLLTVNTTRGLTEQSVMTNISTLAIVASGMLATLLSVFLLATLSTLTLFHAPLVQRWAESVKETVTVWHYFTLSAFVASIGLGVGALGASFEGQHYFQHVTFVDEEV